MSVGLPEMSRRGDAFADTEGLVQANSHVGRMFITVCCVTDGVVLVDRVGIFNLDWLVPVTSVSVLIPFIGIPLSNSIIIPTYAKSGAGGFH